MFDAAEKNGEAEHKQHVADDRSGNGGFDHIGQTFGKRDAGDDQLGGITESGVEQSAQAFSDADGECLGGAPDPARDRNDPERGTNKERSRAATSGPEAQQDREQNEDKKPVEGQV